MHQINRSHGAQTDKNTQHSFKSVAIKYFTRRTNSENIYPLKYHQCKQLLKILSSTGIDYAEEKLF